MGEARMKNPAAVVLGRKGGKAKSEAKTRAARENIRKRWANHIPKTKPTCAVAASLRSL